MNALLLGIDIGTFESKGVLVDAHGTVIARARRRHELSTPAPGHVEHDAEQVWWSDFCVLAQQLSSAVPSGAVIAGVGTSGIGPCVLPVDADFNPLRPAILYGIDTRAVAEIDELTNLLGKDELFRRTGNVLTSQSAGPKILWVERNEPEIADKTRWYLTCQSFLVARLTGEVATDHATAGYVHPIYDSNRNEWTDDGVAELFDLSKMPRLLWSDEVVGRVTASASHATGIPEGTPVVMGAADAVCEAVAATVVDVGDMMLMYGSSGFFIQVIDDLPNQEVLWTAPYAFRGTHVATAGTSTAGTATRWIADILGLDHSMGDDRLFGELIALSREAVCGADGVLLLPHFAGERTPFHDPSSRAAFVGMSMSTGRAEIARSVIEGIAHSVAFALQAYDDIGQPPRRLIAIGGGTKNAILVQTVSDLLGRTQHVADTDGAAFGDAILAALAIGVLPDPKAISRWIPFRDDITPDESRRESLARDHERLRRVYDALAPIYSEGISL